MKGWDPQYGESEGNKRIKSKGQRWQKHHRLQSGSRPCVGQKKGPAAGHRSPGRPHKDVGPVQALRSVPDPFQYHK